MNHQNENSVVMALDDLFQIEHERKAEEAAIQARKQAEHQKHEAETHGRIVSLRAELAAVQASRDAMRERWLATEVVPSFEKKSQVNKWALVLGTIAVVLAGVVVGQLSGNMVVSNAPTGTTPKWHVAPQQPVETAAPEPIPPSNVEPTEKQVLSNKQLPHPKTRSPNKPRKPRKGKSKHQTKIEKDKPSTVLDFSKCGKDPMCGGKLDNTESLF